MAPDVFLSYARRDAAPMAGRLAADLDAQGITAWLDTERLSGGANWTKELERALADCRKVIALISPGSAESDICRAEQIMALDGGKPVIPVLALPSSPVPVHLKPYQYIDLSSEIRYRSNLPELVRSVRNSEPVKAARPARSQINTAPALPPYYIEREDVLALARATLLSDGPSRQVAITAVAGMGGIGKTVLASALCEDPVIRAAFPDGILWVTIGQNPADVVAPLRVVGDALGAPLERFQTLERARAELSGRLRESAALIVLDDVWDPRHIEPFRTLAPACRVLITTRDRSIATVLGAPNLDLSVLSEQQSYALLAQWADLHVNALPSQAAGIVRQCGNLPLAIAMIGAGLRGAPHRWDNVLHRLKTASIDRFEQQFPNYPYPNLIAAMQVSLDTLSNSHREMYLRLAVFPDDLEIPLSALETIWQSDRYDAEDLADYFVTRSLALRTPSGGLMLHDIQLDVLRSLIGGHSLVLLHQLMVERYRTICPNGWSRGPSDGYFFQHLLTHLVKAGYEAEVRKLLCDLGWLRSKLTYVGLRETLLDFDLLAEDEDLRTVRNVLRLSGNTLAGDPGQLAPQILGRLLDPTSQRLESLIAQALQDQSSKLKPTVATLAPPGGCLLRIMNGHAGYVTDLNVGPDGQTLLSASSDSTVRLWDCESGQTLRIFGVPIQSGDRGHASSVSISPDLRRMAVGYEDEIKIWDLVTGKQMKTFALTHKEKFSVMSTFVGFAGVGNQIFYHSQGRSGGLLNADTGAQIRGIGDPSRFWFHSLSSDGQIYVGGGEKTLECWSLERGVRLATASVRGQIRDIKSVPGVASVVLLTVDGELMIWDYKGTSEPVTFEPPHSEANAVAVDYAGKRVLTIGSGFTIWDLKTRKILKKINVDTRETRTARFFPDGERLATAGPGNTIKIWNLNGREKVVRTRPHKTAVHSVAIAGEHVVSSSLDGSIVVSARRSGQRQRSFEMRIKIGKEAASLDWIRVSESENKIFALLSNSAPERTAVLLDLRDSTKLGEFSLRSSSPYEGSWAHVDWKRSCLMYEDQDGYLTIAELPKGKVIRRLATHTQAFAIAVNAEGSRAYTAMGMLRCWDLETGSKQQESQPVDDIIQQISITPDERFVLCGGTLGTVHVWDVRAGQWLPPTLTHGAPVTGIAAAGNTCAISVAEDATLRVWNLESQSEIAKFTADAPLTCCAANSELTEFVCGDQDGQVHYLEFSPR